MTNVVSLGLFIEIMGKRAYKISADVSFSQVNESDTISLIEMVRQGIKFTLFQAFALKSPFSLNEWSNLLHISERTMQRYQKEEKKFDPIQSEKILQIALLFQLGVHVFGDTQKFNSWIDSNNVALGGIKPKSLLDNAFGIELIKDELTKIEHGVLA